MKHARLCIALLLLTALLLSACGQSAQQAVPEQESANEEAAPVSAKAPLFDGIYYQTLAGRMGDRPMTGATDNVFSAKFEGDKVAGTAELVDGKYLFSASKTDGEAWHVKLECNYHTIPGRDYRVSYHFRSDVAGLVKFGDFQEFQIVKGNNTVTGLLVARSDVSYLDLQLGALPPFNLEFSCVEVEELEDKVLYTDLMPAAFRYDAQGAVYEQHDEGYEQQLTLTEDSAVLHMGKAPSEAEVWKSRLFIKTGVTPEPGQRYRVSADLIADKGMDFEICYNNADREKGYAALYGQHLDAGAPKTVEQIVAVPQEGFSPRELVLQFALGKAPGGTNISVSNIRVETVKDGYSNALPVGFALDKVISTGKTSTQLIPKKYTNIPLPSFSYSGTDTVSERHDDGYVVNLEESGSSATLIISQAPENPGDRGVWKAKLCAATGVTLEPGVSYRVSFDLNSEKDQAEYEACFDGDYENAYGALYGRSLSAGGTDHVEYTVTPDVSHGPLTLRLQMGKTDTAAGNTVTLSNLKLEKLTPQFEEIVQVPYNTGSVGNVSEEHYDGVEQSVSASGGSATLNITAARSGGGVWSSKLLIRSGVTPEAGAKYRVSVKLDASGSTGDYEILYQNSGGELYGGQWGLSGPGTFSSDFTAPDSGCGELVLVFQLGNSAAGSSITVSDMQIKKITTEDVELDLGGFAYPVTTGGGSQTIPAGYEAQTLSLSAASEAWDGFKQSASASGSSATLSITAARPADAGGVWSSKLFVKTGVTPEAGQKYRVSFSMSATADPEEFEIKYDNGGAEGGYGGQWGQRISAGSYGLEFTAPESGCGELILRFQLGNSPAPNTITVSNIKVEKWVPEHTEETGGTTQNNSFFLETNPDTEATLTGDGASASVLVTKPGDDWHIKLYAKPGVTLEAGKTYRIETAVSGADGWNICYKRLGGGENDFDGELSFGGTVVNQVTPGETGTLEILLKLGAVAKDGKVTVSGIRILEKGKETEGENLFAGSLSTGSRGNVNFWAHDGYAATLSNSGSSASLSVSAVPADGREVWKLKLFVETGAALEEGKTYRVSANVQSGTGLDYEICYNGPDEKDFGAQYGLNTQGKQPEPYIFTAQKNGELILQFSLGNAPGPCTVTVSGVKVEEMKEGAGESVMPSFSYDSAGSIDTAADGGYLVALEKGDSSATLRILQAPEERNPWNVKLFAHTGFTPEKGKGYRVSFDIESEKPQSVFEVFYDGSSEAAYGQLGQSLSAGKKTISYTIMPGDSKGELTLQLRPGRTDGTEGNSYTVSNVKIEEVTFEKKTVEGTAQAATLWTHETYGGTLEKKADRVTVQMGKTPAAAELEPWKTKLFIDTGVTLKAGEKYRISLDARSDAETYFEICYNRDEEEKGFGAQYGLTAYPETRTFEYTAYAGRDTHLIIQVSLGKCAAPNSFTVSHVKVEKVGERTQLGRTEHWFPQLQASVQPGAGEGSLRIEGETLRYYMPTISGKDGDNKLTVSQLPLASDQSYVIRFRARADKPLDFLFVLNRAGAWDTAVYEELALTEQWQEFTFEIPAGAVQDADYELLWEFGFASNAAQKSAVAEIDGLSVEGK